MSGRRPRARARSRSRRGRIPAHDVGARHGNDVARAEEMTSQEKEEDDVIKDITNALSNKLENVMSKINERLTEKQTRNTNVIATKRKYMPSPGLV